MRLINLFLLSLIISIAGSPVMYAQGLLYELHKLYHVDHLPQYLNSEYVEQFSSYDRTGGNDDGFSGTYSYIRTEGEDQVLAEMKGPGVINRIFIANPSSDTISFYFDGESEPTISLPSIELFTGNRFPFLNPIVGHELGGYYNYLPLPYSKSCKVIYKGKMRFYQLQYRTYPGKTKIISYTPEWTEEEKKALQNAINLWEGYGTNFLEKLYNSVSVETKTLNIYPGDTSPVFEMNKGGRIVGIEIDRLDRLDRNDNNLVLRARWDRENQNAIDVPVKDLFGFYFGEKSMQSLIGGTTGETSYFYYPMPFSNSANLELVYMDGTGHSPTGAQVTIRIYYTSEPREKTEGKFYIHWRHDRPEEGIPYFIMPDYQGKGHYVGTILACQGLLPGSTGFFEGDDQAAIDGELRIHGTGSEEFFNGAWYNIPDRWDMAYSMPTHGCLGYNRAASRTGGYRHYFADKLNFSNNFLLTIEHGPEGNKFPVDYRSMAFYYAEYPLPQKPTCPEIIVYPDTPALRFQGNFIPILRFRYGSLINEFREGRMVLVMQPDGIEKKIRDYMFVQFNLEIPVDGSYKLYCSYYLSLTSGDIKFMQRQVTLTEWSNIIPEGNNFVEREFIGKLKVKDGSATLTVHLTNDENNHFCLHELFLVKESVD